jgi:hypothetical protein
MKTPEEMFTGQIPDVSNLRVFGTKVFVYILKHQMEMEMEAKAARCIFLKLDELTKGYRCYCPKTKRILISRDVFIIESSSGSCQDGDETPTTFPFQLFRLRTIQHTSGTNDTPPLENCEVLPPSQTDIVPEQQEEGSRTPVGPPTSPTPPIETPSQSGATPQNLSSLDTPDQSTPIQVYTCRQLPTLVPNPVRKSSRTRRLSVRLEGYVGSLETKPLTYKTASQDPRWLAAMQEEVDSLQENNTWTLTSLPHGKKAITSKWV